MRTRRKVPYPRLYSIDPGLGGTGWAFWEDGRLMHVGIVHDRAKDDTLAARCEGIVRQLDTQMPVIDDKFVNIVMVIEMPQHMASAKGIAAQAGSVYKLAFLVGYIANAFNDFEVIVTTPMEWKGQLPKDVVQQRVIRRLGVRTCVKHNIRSHAWDAVGLGLWANGRL